MEKYEGSDDECMEKMHEYGVPFPLNEKTEEGERKESEKERGRVMIERR